VHSLVLLETQLFCMMQNSDFSDFCAGLPGSIVLFLSLIAVSQATPNPALYRHQYQYGPITSLLFRELHCHGNATVRP